MNLDAHFLFATDLDGTLLPNTGKTPAPGCLERTQNLLNSLKARGVPICFVTGRHLSLAKKGITTFRLPLPDWWICNVGTEIYNATGKPDEDWEKQLGPKLNHDTLRHMFSEIPGLLIQEPNKQGRHKFSLYYPKPLPGRLRAEILNKLADNLQLIVSVEERSGRTLLDIIPVNAGEKNAVDYMTQRHGLIKEQVFFSGDSASDSDVLLSGVCGTVVGNTPAAVQSQLKIQQMRSAEAQLYMATSRYGDGVIEGLCHYGFWPSPANDKSHSNDTNEH